MIWKHADELLRLIDDKFCCQPESGTYNYTKRNVSTSHVHMVWSFVLNTMMDKCEALLFKNS